MTVSCRGCAGRSRADLGGIYAQVAVHRLHGHFSHLLGRLLVALIVCALVWLHRCWTYRLQVVHVNILAIMAAVASSSVGYTYRGLGQHSSQNWNIPTDVGRATQPCAGFTSLHSVHITVWDCIYTRVFKLSNCDWP